MLKSPTAGNGSWGCVSGGVAVFEYLTGPLSPATPSPVTTSSLLTLPTRSNSQITTTQSTAPYLLPDSMLPTEYWRRFSSFCGRLALSKGRNTHLHART